MTLVCIKAFGNFKPGDELDDVPAKAAYDETYFTEKKAKGGDK